MQQVEVESPGTLAVGGPAAGRRASLLTTGLVTLLLCATAVVAGTLASSWLGPVTGPAAPAGRGPVLVLVVRVAMVIALTRIVRMPACLALVLAAMAAGLMARVGSLPLMPGMAAAKQPAHWTLAIELTTYELGEMMMKVGLIIALAAVIGTCMLESGAADKVVRRCLAVFGERRAAVAILVGTYIVSIPIFFDTIFMLLIPLAKALRLRTGKDYVLYMLSICCAAMITHSMVIPHPGPAAMADNLHLDAGRTIIVGWVTGILPLAFGWLVINWINKKVDVPLVETPGATLADLHAVMERREDELPSLFWSLTPIVLPVLLISIASFTVPLSQPWPSGRARLYAVLEFLGNRHVALIISLVIAAGVLMTRRRMTLREIGAVSAPSIELAAIMILITAAGGAFGLMLKNAHVADAIKDAVTGTRINLVLLAWGVAGVIRIAQGSATVAMLVTSAMMYPLTQAGLPYHPIYLFIAIGYGAMICSWMNDGGFWVVGKLGGMTESQTLKTWTVMTTAISIGGLGTALLLSNVLPFKQG